MSPAVQPGTRTGLARIVKPVAPQALLVTFVVGVVVAYAVNLGIRWLGQHVLDAAKGLKPMDLIPPTIFPVLGNCFGCFMSWRVPSANSIKSFLGVGGFMTLVGIGVSLAMLPGKAGTEDFVVAVAISVAPVLVIVTALLYLVAHQPEVPRPTPWWREEPTL
jgi:hypothetical protein